MLIVIISARIRKQKSEMHINNSYANRRFFRRKTNFTNQEFFYFNSNHSFENNIFSKLKTKCVYFPTRKTGFQIQVLIATHLILVPRQAPVAHRRAGHSCCCRHCHCHYTLETFFSRTNEIRSKCLSFAAKYKCEAVNTRSEFPNKTDLPATKAEWQELVPQEDVPFPLKISRQRSLSMLRRTQNKAINPNSKEPISYSNIFTKWLEYFHPCGKQLVQTHSMFPNTPQSEHYSVEISSSIQFKAAFVFATSSVQVRILMIESHRYVF